MTKQDMDLLPKCIRKTKICSGNKAKPNEAKYTEAKEVASDYGISTKGKKGDVCKRLIANHLAVANTRLLHRARYSCIAARLFVFLIYITKAILGDVASVTCATHVTHATCEIRVRAL